MGSKFSMAAIQGNNLILDYVYVGLEGTVQIRYAGTLLFTDKNTVEAGRAVTINPLLTVNTATARE